MKYKNETHQMLVEALQKEGYPVNYPLMLTADQNDTVYTLSTNFTGTTIKIPRSEISREAIREINEDENYRVILNHVWEATF